MRTIYNSILPFKLINLPMFLFIIFITTRALAYTLTIGEDEVFTNCNYHESGSRAHLLDMGYGIINISAAKWATARASSIDNTIRARAKTIPPPQEIQEDPQDPDSVRTVRIAWAEAGAVTGVEFELDLNGYNWVKVRDLPIKVTTNFSYRLEVESHGSNWAESEGFLDNASFQIEGWSGIYESYAEIDSWEESSDKRYFSGTAQCTEISDLDNIYHPEERKGWLGLTDVRAETVSLPKQDYGGLQFASAEITIHSIKVEFIRPEPTLEILDGADFSAGREISNNPERLISGGTSVTGAVTDGVTRLLLKLPLNELNEVTFSLEGTGNPKEDGILRSIDGAQEGQTIKVISSSTSQGEVAFCVYQAPENFAREGHDEDKTVSERKISVKIKSNRSPDFEFTQEIKLVRPPLILVHGLWSGPEMWDDFKVMLKNKIPDLQIFMVDYRNKNSNYFLDNKDVPYSCKGSSLKEIRKKFKESYKIAMIQADVLGHSMGGLLARRWGGLLNEMYKRDDNFKEGDINKLISLDSPHFGSFLADFAIGFISTLDSITKNILLNETRKIGFALDKGAIDDLQTMSPAIIYLNGVPTDSASHAIIGNFELNVDLLPGKIGDFFNILKYYGFDTKVIIIPDGSDIVVSVNSQAGGLVPPKSSTFGHWHCDATGEEVINKTVELLNTGSDSSSFRSGFPVNLWPEF